MSDAKTREANLLDAVLARYRAEGFDAFAEPPRSVLPSFLGDARPDAIAIGAQKKIAIEIVRSNVPTDRLKRLRAALAGQDEWELAVFYVAQSEDIVQLRISSRAAIEAEIEEVLRLYEHGQHSAALVMGWSSLEAIARALLPDEFARPQPALRLIEVLALQGLLTPDRADVLRGTAKTRNELAHGGLDLRVDCTQLDALISTVRALIKRLPKTTQ